VVSLVDPRLKGVVLYASMSGDERLNLERIRSWSQGRRGGEFFTLPEEVLKAASLWTYLEELSVPYSVHHGTKDAQVPPEWSFTLCRRLKDLGKPVVCLAYPAGHLFRGEADRVFSEWALTFLRRALR
jgi:dipeptidyl aminopeptidase/acylaminoacyl peptidase